MRPLNRPLLFLGPSVSYRGSVSYRRAGFVLHTTSVTNVIVYENGAPGVVEGATCVVTSGPAFGVSPISCVVNSPGLVSISGQGQVC